MHDRACRRVLKKHLLTRVQLLLDRERGERGLVESGENQLPLAGVDGDVSDGVDSRHVGLELLGVRDDVVAVQLQSPLRNGAKRGRQSEEHQQPIARKLLDVAGGLGHVHSCEPSVLDGQTGRVADHEAHASGIDELLHLPDRGLHGAELFASMYQGQRSRLVDQVDRPVEGRVAAAQYHDVPVVDDGRVAQSVEHLLVDVLFDAVDPQRHGLKRSDAAGDDHRLGFEFGACAGGHEKREVVGRNHLGDQLVQVEGGVERLDLLLQPLDQFDGRADGNGGDVVDGLVGIELRALSTRVGEGFDHVRRNSLQAEFEDLEQAAGSGADYERVGLNGLA